MFRGQSFLAERSGDAKLSPRLSQSGPVARCKTDRTSDSSRNCSRQQRAEPIENVPCSAFLPTCNGVNLTTQLLTSPFQAIRNLIRVSRNDGDQDVSI